MECCRGKQWTSRKHTYRYKPPCFNPLMMAGMSTPYQSLYLLDVAKDLRLDAKCFPIQRFVFSNMRGHVLKCSLWLTFGGESANNYCFALCCTSCLYWDIFWKKYEKLLQKSSWINRLRDLRDDLRDLSIECNVLILFVSLFEQVICM